MVLKNHYGGNTIYLELDGDIKSGRHHINLIRAFNKAKYGDVIYFDVTSYGGRVSGTARIAFAMYHSKATVHVRVASHAMSGGAVLTCYGNSRLIAPGAVIMFHRPSYNIGAKRNLVPMDSINFKSFDKLFSKCKKYLNKKQLKRFYAGEDVFLVGG